MNTRALLALSCLVAMALAACTVGPNYQAPTMPTPTRYLEADPAAQPPVSASDADLSSWWKRFNDPLLDSLIGRALAGSPTLEAAASRIREARLEEKVTGAAEYPSLSASATALDLQSNRGAPSASATGTGGAPSAAAGFAIPPHLSLYSAGFDATWEVDLFGATRRAVEQAEANTGASLWAMRDGEVSLTAEVANDYLTLREAQARIATGQAELARQRDLFALIQARRKAGFVTSLDVYQQSTLVETAAAQIPQLEAQAKSEVHALGILIGEPPEALAAELAADGPAISPAPPSLPVGLPSELLRRRPDIREAERKLAAANAEVGVRTAALYPKLNLIGLGSFSGMSLGDLFSSQNLTGAALGMVSEPVFDAGRNRANLGAAKEELAQARLAYQIVVLGALRDVEDALARYNAENTRRGHLSASVSAAWSTLSIAQDQYKTGFVTFINVLQTQNALLNAQDQLTQSNALVQTDLVALYKALGGGWSLDDASGASKG